MKVRWGFLVGVAASLGIHGGLAIVMPSPEPDILPKPAFHAVELRRLEIPLPNPSPQKEPEKPPDIGRPALLPSFDERSSQAAGLSLKEMALAARSPDVKAPPPSPTTILLPDGVETTPFSPPERVERGDRPRGTPDRTRLAGGSRLPSSLSAPERVVTDRLRTLRSRLIREELRTTSRAKPTAEEIQGPVATRELVFRPPPPQAPEGAEGEIELKFWVLSDGTVGRIVLLRRGDLTLETAAIQNLKEWKFNSLPLDAEVPEQWGTLRVRFLSAAAGAPPSR
ncbi:MAG: energy transducer TonB [Nitrospinota bacterium]